MMTNRRLEQAERVVVKIGSALLVEEQTGALHRHWLDSLCDDLAALKSRGKEIVIVSSGAVALGVEPLRLERGTFRLEESQAAAAVGQIRLAHAWQESLARHDVTVAQILLTPSDTEERRRYLNARNTIEALLARGAVPVINENDTVATAELRYGDNDRLAARVAQMISADCLILLSDVAGLYTADPGVSPDARLVPEIRQITAEIEAMASAPKKIGVGAGGMITKIEAAKIATRGGCDMAIIAGKPANPVDCFLRTGEGSWFLAGPDSPANARKQWIAGALEPKGVLVLDNGAIRALREGNSLLPAGVTQVVGDFEKGDPVRLTDQEGGEIARGLVAYSAAETRRVIGHHSDEIEKLLGYRGRSELIHRDDLVLT